MAAKLPFDLDDGAAVGRLYLKWDRRATSMRRYQLDLWTYIFVRRYFLIRFVRPGADYTMADVEEVVEQAYRRVEQKRSSLREKELYPNWVSVVCRRTFLNFVSRNPPRVRMDRVAEPAGQEDDLLRLHDDAIRASALDAAIARLPGYLQTVIAMKLIQDLAYPVIAERTGAPLASVRAYVHKALVRLRADEDLIAVLGYETPSTGSIRK